QKRRDAAIAALRDVPGLKVARPDATFYLFPNVTGLLQRKGYQDVAELAKAALHDTGVSFCTRHHFGTRQKEETEHYIRLAYSGISCEMITEGIGRLAEWVRMG
ncbi:MAG: aspartate aminotransferase, partial [Pseudomonadota bacterium]